MLPVCLSASIAQCVRETHETHPDLVHDGSDDDVPSTAFSSLGERIPSPRDRDAVCVRVHVFPDDVVFAAD